jgi:RNA polymerase sigma-70 factor (sigma-E family)
MTPEAVAVSQSFDSFFQSQHDPLLRLAHLLTGNPAVAEELVQEALLATHQRWAGLDNPAGYARRALVNLCHSHQRRRFVERRHSRADQPRLTLPPEIDETWAVIRGLPHDQRAVLVLRFYEDMRMDDIAALLDKPVGTVKSLLHRALARLKETLA